MIVHKRSMATQERFLRGVWYAVLAGNQHISRRLAERIADAGIHNLPCPVRRPSHSSPRFQFAAQRRLFHHESVAVLVIWPRGQLLSVQFHDAVPLGPIHIEIETKIEEMLMI